MSNRVRCIVTDAANLAGDADSSRAPGLIAACENPQESAVLLAKIGRIRLVYQYLSYK